MKRMVTWGSPKEYQQKDHNPNSNPAKLPKPRSKYCKKLKGSHDMQLKSKELHKWWPPEQGKGTWWEEWRCTACQRKDLKFIEVTLEG